jgi:hypothetical protein
MRLLWVFAAASVCAQEAFADILWDQPWDGVSGAYVAQEFPDAPGFTAFQYDDFTAAEEWASDRLTVSGFDRVREGGVDWFIPSVPWSLPAEGVENSDVIAQIWDGLPGSLGGARVMESVDGGEQLDTGALVFDFGGQRLSPGHYWLTVYVVRPFRQGGQWFWLSTGRVQGGEHFFYNPGGGFGLGQEPVAASAVPPPPGHTKTDMVFTLEGRPVRSSARPRLLPEF